MTQPLHLLLDAVAQRDASDLHLSPGEMPWLRVQGEMDRLPLQSGPLSGEQIERLLEPAMGPEDLGRWKAEGTRSVNFGYAAPGIGRFRVNLAATLTGTAAVIRRVAHQVPTAEELGLPAAVCGLADLPAGLVFVTGASGEGKSTTLAALLDRINRTRGGHILTIEDPVEYVHAPARCRITQREVGIHTESFTHALEDALRQDPDVIVVGEVRTAEQLQLILQAAETGHLVMGSLHTINAVNAISRMVGMVETARQGQVRAQVAEALRGIVTQRLIPTVDGRRIAAFEILVNAAAIAANIEAGNTVEIRSALESRRDGMRTLEQSLAELVRAGHVTVTAAREHANDPKALERHLGSSSGDSAYR
jgi:twitching motility protein PilT